MIMSPYSNLYLRLQQLLADLSKMGTEKPFIGYGNPDADIVIIGKECAYDLNNYLDKKDYEKFYKPNFDQWEKSFLGHGFAYSDGVEKGKVYSYENNAFHPLFPFFWKFNNLITSCSRHTSSTYFYYQMLIDKIRAEIEGKKYEKSECITFFRECFITELNDICMRNHNNTTPNQEETVESHIRARFDWMRKTNFFKQFKVVVLACGPYANAIKKDPKLKKELFGDALIVYCGQLSQWRKRDLEGEPNNPNKPNMIKEIAGKKPKISSIAENQRFIDNLPNK